jgi:hypothetical protein
LTQTPARARPPLEHLPANFNPLIWRVIRSILPTWVRWQTAITNIQLLHTEQLASLYADFQAGKTRFLMAFRHPSPEDAYGLAHLIWQAVPQTAKEQGILLKQPVHAHFIYDRGIPLWAGPWVGWLYAQLGGTSIQRGKLDLVALKSARYLFANGQFPMVAAPEGGNNGHNEIVSPLEPGIAQLGFWCVDDLRKAHRAESVMIVPLGIQYRYVNPPWTAVEALLAELEVSSGLGAAMEPLQTLNPEHFADIGLPLERALTLYSRLYRLAEHLLTVMEGYYQKFYQATMREASSAANTPTAGPNAALAQRLQTLLDLSLRVAEDYFGLPPKGSVIDRCRRLEQAGWDRIFREELKDEKAISAVERGLADRIAEEAELRMWHMRLVESFVAVTGRYVLEKPSVDRFAETVLLMRDVIIRIQGNHPFPRPQLGPQKAILTVGEPISVSDRWLDYKQGRKQAVETLTQDLQTRLEGLILKD